MSYTKICSIEDITPNVGVGVLIDDEQVALFRVIGLDKKEAFFAVSNYDPFSKANVISRGLVGCLKGKIVVASPVYKQHFCLSTGNCLEDESVSLKIWDVKIKGADILLNTASSVVAA